MQWYPSLAGSLMERIWKRAGICSSNPVLVHHDERRSKDPILSPQDLYFTLLFLFYYHSRPQDVFPDILFMDGPTRGRGGIFRAFPATLPFHL